MKKVFVLLSLTLCSSVIFNQVALAEEGTKAIERDAEITFEAGAGVITPPIDPNQPGKIDPDEGGNGGTGQEGPLSIDYVSQLQFGEVKLKAGRNAYNVRNHSPRVQVTDTRGTGAGWHLTVKMDEFLSKDKTKKLSGVEMVLDGEIMAGNPDNISVAPTTKKVTLKPGVSQTVMNAAKDSGRGTWLTTYKGQETTPNVGAGGNTKIQLFVLGESADVNTSYSSTLTWDLRQAPN